jgi:hypothetical protein
VLQLGFGLWGLYFQPAVGRIQYHPASLEEGHAQESFHAKGRREVHDGDLNVLQHQSTDIYPL